MENFEDSVDFSKYDDILEDENQGTLKKSSSGSSSFLEILKRDDDLTEKDKLLRSQVQDLETMIDDLDTTRCTLQEKNSMMKKVDSMYANDEASVREKLGQLKDIVTTLQRRERRMRNKASKKSIEVLKKDSQIETLMKKVNGLNTSLGELEREERAKQEKMKKDFDKKLEKVTSNLKEELTHLRREKDRLEIELTHKTSTDSLSKMGNIVNTSFTSQESLPDLERKEEPRMNDVLSSRVNVLQKEILRKELFLEKVKRDLDSSRFQMEIKEEKISNLVKENEEYKESLHQSLSEMKLYEKKKEETRELVVRLYSEYEDKGKRIKNLNRQLVVLDKRYRYSQHAAILFVVLLAFFLAIISFDVV